MTIAFGRGIAASEGKPVYPRGRGRGTRSGYWAAGPEDRGNRHPGGVDWVRARHGTVRGNGYVMAVCAGDE